jgi:hypothetical protein
MNKKSLDQRTAKKLIKDGRNNGKTDQEIYNELSQKFYDKKTIALLISGIATTEKKKKYKIYNNILLGLIGFFVLFKVFHAYNLIEETEDIWFILLASIVILLFAGYFMYGIAKYEAATYRICGIFTILIFLQSSFWQHIWNFENVVEILMNVFVAAAIVFFSFYLDKKIFPNYSYRKMKKDDNGEYILD